MAEEYKCARCGGVWQKGWTDEESLAECRQYFGNLRADETAVVCEDCFQLMHPEKHPHIIEESVAETIRKRLTKE